MKQWTWKVLVVLALSLAGVGCGSDLRDDLESGDGGAGGGDGGSSRITNTDNGGGVTTTRVDATTNDLWVYFDFESNTEVAPSSPESSGDWDLSFQRFKIKSNSGISGTGSMGVAVLPGANFDTLTKAPASGYLTDQADSADEGSDPDLAFLSGDGWYSYNPSDHTLSPREIVYVVRTVEGQHFKVKMTGYYDDAGTAGYPTFKWAAIAAPPSASSITVDASSTSAWVYFSVTSGGVVSVSDPATSSAWDVAFNRTKIQTNSGTSGGAIGGARKAPSGSAFDTLADSPTIGFAVDGMIPNPGPPGSGEFSGNPVLNGWYNYDPATHAVSPKDEVFLVRTASGGYGKLKITGYANGIYTLQVSSVARRVDTITSTVTSTDGAVWVYWDLRRGEAVTVADPATSLGWDVGFSRTEVRTNSGTSGGGMGGGLDPSAANLADVMSAPGSGYTVDSMLPNPGPPGSGEFSGNSVLNGWYDYDPVTHATTPKNKVFLVRTADGGFVKAKITGYTGGVYTIDWAYSGAGETSF
jgi:hypothetical protein